MTIRFAAAMNGTMPTIAGVICIGAPLDAANDNAPPVRIRPLAGLRRADPVDGLAMDVGIAEALMHFARHGLSAAERAREEAQAAHDRGDLTARGRWLGICRQLDRRMATALARRLAG